MMIVVVIIAVLVTVAIVAYTRYLRSSRIVGEKVFAAKIQSMQETYFQRFGTYCDVTGGTPYPATVPQTAVVFAPAAGNWALIGARPESGETHASWTVVASTATAHAVSSGPPWAQAIMTATTGVPWYAIRAQMDIDANGSPYTEIFSTSQKPQPWTVNENN